MERNKRADLLKGIGIILVVLGHFTEPFNRNHFVFKAIWVLIYSFHMPLFAFLSGFFSKFKLKSILRLGIMYLIFQFIYLVYRMCMGSIGMEPAKILNAIITPYWHLWYLFGLIVWKLSLYVVEKVKGTPLKVLVTACFIGLSLLAGYINLPLELQRVFVFFPFFVGGYFLKGTLFAERVAEHKIILSLYRIIFLVMCAIIIAVSDGVNTSILAPYQTYAEGGYTLMQRALFLLVASLMVHLSTVSVGNISCAILEKLGKSTLPIFGLHALVFKTIYKYDIFWLEIFKNPACAAAFIIVNVVICVFVFSRSFFVKMESFLAKHII